MTQLQTLSSGWFSTAAMQAARRQLQQRLLGVRVFWGSGVQGEFDSARYFIMLCRHKVHATI